MLNLLVPRPSTHSETSASNLVPRLAIDHGSGAKGWPGDDGL